MQSTYSVRRYSLICNRNIPFPLFTLLERLVWFENDSYKKIPDFSLRMNYMCNTMNNLFIRQDITSTEISVRQLLPASVFVLYNFIQKFFFV